MGLVFKEETHQYFLDGKEIPSVSKVLEPLHSLVYSDDIDSLVLAAAAARGTAIHEATEVIDATGGAEVPKKWQGYTDAYHSFLKEHNVTWLYTEHQLGSSKYGFAGTVDRIGEIDGNNCILDIKTTYKIHDKLVIPQLTAYQMLATENGLSTTHQKLYILQLQNTGAYTLQEFKSDEKIFKALLTMYEFMNHKEEVF